MYSFNLTMTKRPTNAKKIDPEFDRIGKLKYAKMTQSCKILCVLEGWENEMEENKGNEKKEKFFTRRRRRRRRRSVNFLLADGVKKFAGRSFRRSLHSWRDRAFLLLPHFPLCYDGNFVVTTILNP